MLDKAPRLSISIVDNWYPYSVNLVLAQILHEADGRGIEARLVLITNIRLQRGGIWNLSFKHHKKITSCLSLI